MANPTSSGAWKIVRGSQAMGRGRRPPPPASQGGQDGEGQLSPGQSIRHYAPDVPTFIFPSGILAFGGLDTTFPQVRARLASCLIIDFYGQLAPLASFAADYRDLSPGGDVHEAAMALFDTLRWAEKRALLPLGDQEKEGQEGVSTILLCDVRDVLQYLESEEEKEFGEALQDRITRAASGRTITPTDLGL